MRSIRYSEFVQAARRFRPSDLVPLLATYSAEAELQQLSAEKTVQSFPWAIAAIAKESLLRGNEFRATQPTKNDLSYLIKLFNVALDVPENESAASLLTGIFYEQFPYQESLYEEMARTHALLVHNEPDQDRIPWESILGVGLDDAMRATILLHTWLTHNGGRFDPAILGMPHFQEIFDRVAPRDEIETVANLMTSSVAGFRDARRLADEKATVPIRLERYGFNPLRSTPFIDLGLRGIWAPQTMLVPRVYTNSNLYYRGLGAWGSGFADSLGDRTQRYVGRQLSLLNGIKLHSEFRYAKGKDSVDWIWISEESIILVECKAARLPLDAQAGGDSLEEIMKRYIGKARSQIDNTARLIRGQHPAFIHIPHDRPIIGLITTAEAFYLADTPFSGFDSVGQVPVVTASLRDIEFLVGATESEAAALIARHATSDGYGRRLIASLPKELFKRENPILSEAWKHYEFLDSKLSADD